MLQNIDISAVAISPMGLLLLLSFIIEFAVLNAKSVDPD